MPAAAAAPSSVFVSWPGGIGAPITNASAPFGLKGGRRRSRRATKRSRRAKTSKRRR